MSGLLLHVYEQLQEESTVGGRDGLDMKKKSEERQMMESSAPSAQIEEAVAGTGDVVGFEVSVETNQEVH